MSLWELVQTFVDEERGARKLTPNEMTLRKDLLPKKVDAHNFVREMKLAEVGVHKKFIDEHLAEISRLQGDVAKSDERLVETMRMGSFEKLPGREFFLELSVSTRTETLKTKPNQSDLENYPQFVRRKESVTLEWNKEEMLPVLRKGEILPFAMLEHTYKPKFKPRSEK